MTFCDCLTDGFDLSLENRFARRGSRLSFEFPLFLRTIMYTRNALVVTHNMVPRGTPRISWLMGSSCD